MTDHHASIAIIVPLHNGAELLPACLERLLPEARTLDVPVVVVDDASTDGSDTLVRNSDATLIRLDERGGSYDARNVGWRAVDSEIVVFVDMRSRPRPGWLVGLLASLADPGVLISGGDAVVVATDTPTQRLFVRWQPMLATLSLAHAFLPYVSTANLATRRTVLERLDGFWESSSGGDAEFCWRAQLLLGGRVAYAPAGTVDWEPRRSVRGAMSQFHRYGYHAPMLEHRFGVEGVGHQHGHGPQAPHKGLRFYAERVRHGTAAALQRFVLRLAIQGSRRVGEWRGRRAVASQAPERLFVPGDARVTACRAATERIGG